MHRREGGFYWHMEVGTGRNIYKAFHWPGFASGDRYDERRVMQADAREGVRDSRHVSRRHSSDRHRPSCCRSNESAQFPGKVRPARALRRCRASRRQTGRGAESPRTSPTPTCNIGRCSTTTRPCPASSIGIASSPAMRRVIRSRPISVGPVAVDCRTLVDECRDLSLAATHTAMLPGQRKRPHRSGRLPPTGSQPGSAIVYRVEGTDQCVARIYAFATCTRRDLRSRFPRTAKFTQCHLRARAFPSSQTVYGYLTPILFSGNIDKAETQRICEFRYAKSRERQGEVAASTRRIEPAPSKLSRVEIEYDRDQKCQPRQTTSQRKPAQLNSSIFVSDSRPH